MSIAASTSAELTPGEVLQLLDATITQFNDGRMRVSGLEQHGISKGYTLQSWDIEFIQNVQG